MALSFSWDRPASNVIVGVDMASGERREWAVAWMSDAEKAALYLVLYGNLTLRRRYPAFIRSHVAFKAEVTR
jgi:hypothetical protein